MIFFNKKNSLFDISKTCCLKRFEITKCQKHSFCSEFSELFKNFINLGVTLLQTPQNQVWVTLRWVGIGLINHASKLDGTTVLYLQEVVFRSSGVCFRKKVIETLLKTAEMIRKHEQTWSNLSRLWSHAQFLTNILSEQISTSGRYRILEVRTDYASKGIDSWNAQSSKM